jgi:hypothetical protein
MDVADFAPLKSQPFFCTVNFTVQSQPAKSRSDYSLVRFSSDFRSKETVVVLLFTRCNRG